MIGILPTEWNGITYRSRTEARWAVFFDYLGYKHHYEREGFALDGKLCYLPDFWLDDFDLWVEVKPSNYTDENQKNKFLAGPRLKAASLSSAQQKKILFLLGGPGFNPKTKVPFFSTELIMGFAHETWGMNGEYMTKHFDALEDCALPKPDRDYLETLDLHRVDDRRELVKIVERFFGGAFSLDQYKYRLTNCGFFNEDGGITKLQKVTPRIAKALQTAANERFGI